MEEDMTGVKADPRIEEPTEPGFYKYSGGRQTMLFLLQLYSPGGGVVHKHWYVIMDSGHVDECQWDYIEQALGVWDLERIS